MRQFLSIAFLPLILWGCGDLSLTLNLNSHSQDNFSQGGVVIVVDNLTIRSVLAQVVEGCNAQDLYPIIDYCRVKTASSEEYGLCVEETVKAERPQCEPYTQIIR